MADSPTDQVKDAPKDHATSEDDNRLFAPLKKVAVAAGVAALTPVVKDAVTNAVESAVKKAPELLASAGGPRGVAELAKKTLGGLSDGGEDTGGLVKGVLGAVTGSNEDGAPGGGEAPPGHRSGRRMPARQAEASSRTAHTSSRPSRVARSKSTDGGRRSKSSGGARPGSSGGGRPQSGGRNAAKASHDRGSRLSSRSRQKGARSSKYEERSKADLEERAREIGIEGRSKMNKRELVGALREPSKSSSKSRARGDSRRARSKSGGGSRTKS